MYHTYLLYTKAVKDAFTQSQSMKQRSVQTQKIVTQVTSTQTEKMSRSSNASQCVIEMNSISTMVNINDLGADKCCQTDPPQSRHIQTWQYETQDKKIGPSTKDSSVQVSTLCQIDNACQTLPDISLKHTFAEENSSKSLDMTKAKQPIKYVL